MSANGIVGELSLGSGGENLPWERRGALLMPPPPRTTAAVAAPAAAAAAPDPDPDPGVTAGGARVAVAAGGAAAAGARVAGVAAGGSFVLAFLCLCFIDSYAATVH